MTTIHPHWHAVGAESTPPANPNVAKVPIAVSAPSRKPAALTGIALVLLMGFTFLKNVEKLTAQISEAGTHEIRITEAGLQPSSLTVAPGETLTWINEQETPHILTSDTLLTSEGMLYTEALFPDASLSVTLAEEIIPGTYPYSSLTSTKIAGEIIVAESPPVPPLPSSPSIPSLPSEPPEFALPSEPSPPTSVPPALSPVEGSVPLAAPRTELRSGAGAPSSPIPLLPVNPFVIGSAPTTERPPLPPPEEVDVEPRWEENWEYTPRPFRQPETGPGIFLIATVSLAGLLLVTRRALVKHYH